MNQYKDHLTPHIPFCDMSFDGLDTRDKGHCKEHLAPTGDQFYRVALCTTSALERIRLFDDVILKLRLDCLL